MRLTSSAGGAGRARAASAARQQQRMRCAHAHRAPRPSVVASAAASTAQDQGSNTAAAASPCVRVRFRVARRVAFGESVAVVGAAPELGAWDVASAPRLRWCEGDEWRAVVDFKCGGSGASRPTGAHNDDAAAADDADDVDDDLPPGLLPPATEFKFVVVRGGSGAAAWESGDNRVLDVAGLFPGPGMAVDVAVSSEEGGRAAEAVASVVPLSALDGDAAAATPARAPKQKSRKAGDKQQQRQQQQQQHQSTPAPPVPSITTNDSNSDSVDAEGRAGVGAAGWLGRDVAFMTSNDHSRERPSAATWEVPPGLPQSHPARQLIEGDRDAASWLAKLRVAQRVLVDDAPRQRPRLAAIAHAYAYLQWVATGAIPCAEGGGHFRPNHHARAAQAVFRSLEWALEEDAAEAAQRARREQAGGAAAAAAAADGRVDDGDSDQDDDESCVLPPRLRTILARRLSTKLPSFGEQFTQSVPLTRIRDIAHRGDIPHALKQEIKHTLQNKLHRNAGPEDLVAAEAMLERLESGNERYPDAFMAEFRTFVAELREFFGAASLAALLRDGVRPSLAVGAAAAAASADEGEGEEEEDDEGSSSSSGSAGDSVRALDHFLARKSALDAKPNHEQASLDDLVGVAHALVTVRAVLLGGLASGMRNDAPDAAAATRQRWRLAEARSEDYLFVLLARVVGGMMAAGGAASSSSSGDSAADDAARFLAAADVLAKGSDRAWAAPLGAAVLGLRSLALSGWQPAECAAVERELAAWQDAGGVADDRDGAARRLRASLDRAQRVCAAHADALLAVLPGAASRMGPPLGVPEHAVATFAEAEVRASVAFQLSRLLALLQRAARVAAARAGGGGGGGIAVSEWEPIVAGTARGVLVDVPSMDSDAARRALADAAAQGQGVVLLLREATGDEELGGGGGGGGGAASPLRGIALAQPLPHLSHLGVRARQERVPLATISPEALAREVLPLVGAPVELRVGGDGSTVELVRAAAGAAGAAAAAAGGRAAAGAAAAPKAAAAAAAADAAKAAAAAPLVKPAAPAPAADCSQALEVVPLPDARAETCGAKAASCARLLRLSQAAAGGGRGGGATAPPLFLAPRGAVLPFGAMEAAADAAGVRAEYDALLDRADALSADGGSGGSGEALAELDAACDELGRLVSSLRPPSAALERVLAAFPQEGGAQAPSSPQFLIARSSANVEDLAGLSGAGLYDSVPNVPLRSAVAASSSAAAADLGAAVAAVWASLHTRRAVLARRAAGVPQRSAAMAVLVQEQLAPDVSFVLHTRSPVVVAAGGGGGGNGASSSLALAELAPGLGETLAGASRGSGWRLLLDKGKGELAATLAFANFSEALVPPAPPSGSVGGGIGVGGGGGRGPLIAEALYARAGGRISGDVVEVPVAAPAAAAAAAAPAPPPQKGRTYPLARRRVDYARQRLSASADARGALGAELARVCAALEAEFGGEAQDAEGCVVGFNGAAGGGAGHHQVYVVQSRPQPRED